MLVHRYNVGLRRGSDDCRDGRRADDMLLVAAGDNVLSTASCDRVPDRAPGRSRRRVQQMVREKTPG